MSFTDLADALHTQVAFNCLDFMSGLARAPLRRSSTSAKDSVAVDAHVGGPFNSGDQMKHGQCPGMARGLRWTAYPRRA
eukprot:2086387-Pyramimonas_sp.AAC.1